MGLIAIKSVLINIFTNIVYVLDCYIIERQLYIVVFILKVEIYF